MTQTCSKNPDAPELKKRPRKYATDYKAGQIYAIVGRDQNGEPIYETIEVNTPAFNQFVCAYSKAVTEHEKELADISWKCEKWAK